MLLRLDIRLAIGCQFSNYIITLLKLNNIVDFFRTLITFAYYTTISYKVIPLKKLV